MKKIKKPICITLGDPAGIGPEVITKALIKPSVYRCGPFQIIGDKRFFRQLTSQKLKNLSFTPIDLKKFGKIIKGHSSLLSAKASLACLNKAIELLKAKQCRALVTAPVCKEMICKLGVDFPGHTEYLAKAFGGPKVGMMFVSKNLKTMIVTRHIPINKLSKSINKRNVFDTIHLTHQSLEGLFKVKHPKIAVCGLNPHAGEGGQFGHEEKSSIIPAIRLAQKGNIRVYGPYAADTLFSKETNSHYDTIVAMYHDQGLIPVKTLYFNQLVNLTLGLPFIRTSPAHGTAFNIAKRKIANPDSMCEAIRLANKLSK